MIRKRYGLLLLLMVVLPCSGSLLAGCNKAEESAVAQTVAVDCPSLLESRCRVCHSLARVCRALGGKSESDWQKTIKSMAGRGAEVDSDEQKGLAACLGRGAVEITEFCRDNPDM